MTSLDVPTSVRNPPLSACRANTVSISTESTSNSMDSSSFPAPPPQPSIPQIVVTTPPPKPTPKMSELTDMLIAKQSRDKFLALRKMSLRKHSVPYRAYDTLPDLPTVNSPAQEVRRASTIDGGLPRKRRISRRLSTPTVNMARLREEEEEEGERSKAMVKQHIQDQNKHRKHLSQYKHTYVEGLGIGFCIGSSVALGLRLVLLVLGYVFSVLLLLVAW